MNLPINAESFTRLQEQKVKLEVMPKQLTSATAYMHLEKCKKLAKILEAKEPEDGKN